MWIRTLRLEQVRSFATAECALAPGPNLFIGANGAGKTTLLEAAFLLSHGRSFRAGGREALAARGEDAYRVFAELEHRDGRVHRLGLERSARGWQARRDGERVARLAELFVECAVVCFEPGSHELISGPAQERRAFLDWGVFHVERAFLETWRRYQRALKQRNQVLRDRGSDAAVEAWDGELIRSGESITTMRRAYLDALRADFSQIAGELLPELGEGLLEFEPGYDGALASALGAARSRDRLRQTTTRGPHRADWRPSFERAPLREHLSRGQEKLTALAAVLGQARRYRASVGEWPVLALDDLASELDPAHQSLVLDQLTDPEVQSLITATHLPEWLADRLGHATRFHVEHGRVERRR
ncbi:MAG TPA: DNA replication/repair protein RecF [Candidatus Saccharimonadia bacterium]|nr:DNA replication/repair protein RecF [Candidatus Saccharimonadia bacterium]